MNEMCSEILNVRPVKRSLPEYQDVVRLMDAAFPEYEKVPVWLLRFAALRRDIDFTAYYDGEAFVGLSFVGRTEKMAFLLFLAVNPKILEYVAKVALNIRSDAASLKAEEDRLKKRRQALERKEEKLIMILDRECGGEKTDLGFATLTYRKSESLEVLDSAQAVAWLNENGHSDCIRTPAPEVVKDAVKKLLKKDAKVPGVKLVTNNNCSLK